MSYEYRAYIVPPGGHQDPLASEGLVSIVRLAPDLKTKDVLRMTDKGWFWENAQEGTVVAATLSLPTEAFSALLAAVGRFSGAPSEPRTEASVLREWLGAERKRVDDLIALATGPRLVDHGKSYPGTVPGTRVETIPAPMGLQMGGRAP